MTEWKDISLKPCPFCGSPAKIIPWDDGKGLAVRCGAMDGDCPAWGPEISEKGQELAINFWNTRFPNPPEAS